MTSDTTQRTKAPVAPLPESSNVYLQLRQALQEALVMAQNSKALEKNE